jgi:hypothetical protein
MHTTLDNDAVKIGGQLRLTNNVNPKTYNCYLVISFNDLTDPSAVLDAFQKPITILERIASFRSC